MVYIGLPTSCVFDVFFCVWMTVLKYKIADHVRVQSLFEMLEWPCWCPSESSRFEPSVVNNG